MNIFKETNTFYRWIWLCCAVIVNGLYMSVTHAQPIQEWIITAQASGGLTQQGVLSVQGERPAPEKLLLVISGHPGMTRPYVDANGKIQTRQNGNFLVRSRVHYISEKVALLLLDCRSDFDQICPDTYQASAERADDMLSLAEVAKKRFPTIKEIWAVSTSRGVISTAGLLKHAQHRLSGVIHTAGTYSLVNAQGLDFGPYSTAQFIIHHREDPCGMTLFSDAQQISGQWNISLIRVEGGGGYRGGKCQAFTQHGFTGKEAEVGQAILFIVEHGKPRSLLVR